MLQFIAGLVIGGTVGLFTNALLVAAKRGDENDF
jgi:gas vesicle protein